jgi:hypothetical protein
MRRISLLVVAVLALSVLLVVPATAQIWDDDDRGDRVASWGDDHGNWGGHDDDDHWRDRGGHDDDDHWRGRGGHDDDDHWREPHCVWSWWGAGWWALWCKGPWGWYIAQWWAPWWW